MDFAGFRKYGSLFLALAVLAAVGISFTSCGDGGGAGGGVTTNSAIMERSLSSYASTLYQGYLDTAGCTSIWGWAWDENNPTSTISVDIYDGTTKLATVTANVYRADLAAAGMGNGDHGFSYTPSFTDGKTHTINVYYSGTTTALNGSPMTTATTCNDVSTQGYLDSATCTGIVGWAWEPGIPDSVISVDIYDGSTLLTTVAANAYRADLAAASMGNGNHGFSYVPRFTDGKTHTINVYYSGTTTALNGSPTTTANACSSSSIYQGYLTGASSSAIWGWVWEPSDPTFTVGVDIYDGTLPLVQVGANLYGADLAAAGIGNGYHVFSFTPPLTLTDGNTHTINAYYHGTKIPLTGSPMTTKASTIAATAAQLDGEAVWIAVCEQCHTVGQYLGASAGGIRGGSADMQADMKAANVTTAQINDLVSFLNSQLGVLDAEKGR